MSDRFKFRVFDKETGKYYKSRISKGSGCVVYQHPSDSHCQWVQISTMFAELEQDEKTYLNTELEPDFIIEQCTGLKDKNGNLIYEGDIIKYCVNWRAYVLSYIRIVAWDKNTCGFIMLNSKNQVKPLQKWKFPDPNTHIIEIVGNIHKYKGGKDE